MTPILDVKKVLALCLCILLAAGAWIPLVTTHGENETVKDDPAWDVGTGDTRGNPILIYSVEDLQNMSHDLTAGYALANDIDASGTRGWNLGAGFMPVGNETNRFIGSLDGGNYTITGLYINQSSKDHIGLFGYVDSNGSVRNVGLVDVKISGNRYIGGLVGWNQGSISYCYATGSVTGASQAVGGLVGWNRWGSLDNCYATGSVNGTGSNVGGLVGSNSGPITCCYATGDVNSTGQFIGGLVGQNVDEGSISNCSATGNVEGTGLLGRIGGLVGTNEGNVSNCYATGNVSGTGTWGRFGGLVGSNSGSVSNSHYNIDTVLINGGKHVTRGGLYDQQYRNWFDNGMVLDISDYGGTLVPSYDHYEISEIGGLRDLLGFADSAGYAFRLVSDIDLSSAPGLYIPSLAAEFDGNNHTISDLLVYQSFAAYLGLFGIITASGSARNVVLQNVDITGYEYVGGLAGENLGSISNCHATGSVSGTGDYVGGLVGVNYEGSVENCYTTVRVSGNYRVGGLVGSNWGPITGCHSTGNVSSTSHTIGGLVGMNGDSGSISDSYALGPVSGEYCVGGLVGSNYGPVSNCHATGSVNGTNRLVGGLVGSNWESSISNSHATGSVMGVRNVGGLAGDNWEGSISNCYATGAVLGTNRIVGGLVGSNSGSVENCYATGSVIGERLVGGLVGSTWGDAISSCYATGTVSGTVAVGGLVGSNWECSISNSYASGIISGTDFVGGLVGENQGSLFYCYATGNVSGNEHVGGLVGGDQEGTVENCFWDMETSGTETSDGGTGKTTGEMKQQTTYMDWDFYTMWDIVEGYTYPWLRWFPQPLTPSILSPRHSGTLVRGDSLRFSSAPYLNPDLGYLWNLSDGRSSPASSPGLVPFQERGTHNITFSYILDGEELPVRDTRTLNVVDDTASYPDLSVVEIDIPHTLALSEPAVITYTVRNIGDAPLTGESWHDAVYLSQDPYLDTADRLLTSVAVSGDVTTGGTYQGTLTITFPPVEEGSYFLILSINDGWSFIERHRLNNEKAEATDIAIPELEEGIAHTGGFGAGEFEQYFRIDLPSGTNLLVTLTGPDNLELFLRYGGLPTRTNHDVRSDNGRLVIPAAYAGIWYVLVRGERMSRGGNYTIMYGTPPLILDGSAPDRHVSGNPLELMLTGAGFIAPVQVELIDAGGGSYLADLVDIHSFSRLTASFGADILPEGTYGVRVTRPDKGTAELHGVLRILPPGEAKLETRLILPQSVGYNAPATFYVEYENAGDLSMPAPLLTVTGVQNGHQGAILTLHAPRLYGGFWTSAMPEGFSNTVQFLASGTTPGILRPGEFSRIPIYYIGWQQPWDWNVPPIEWQLRVLGTDNGTPVNLSSMKDGMRPSYIRPDAWEVLWANFADQAGDTWGDYVDMLIRNARYLHRQGQRIDDIDQLLAFSFRQADGFSPLPVLAGRVDAAFQAPGLPIVFERNYLQPLSRRFEPGPLGRGWTHNWQVSLDEKDDGTIVMSDMTGTPRIFQPDGRFHGRYLTQPGDRGSLRTIEEGRFRLVEMDGLTRVFTSDGRLDHVEDTKGNRITCEYDGSLLMRLTHSSGQYLEIGYNHTRGGTRITGITDTFGREVRYAYDGEYLISVRDHDDFTVTYDYSPEGGAREHALTGIHLPGEGKTHLEYDGRGYLKTIYRDGGGGRATFTYDLGSVAVTDLENSTNTFFFDHAGRRTRVENPLGEAYHYLFDETGNLKQITDPAGLTARYTYDIRGNLAGITDPAGQTTRLYYSPTYNQLTAVVDAVGTGTLYGYDGRGNLIELVFADGSGESWSHEPGGSPASWTNRRNSTTEYSYDDAGRLSEKTHTDATRSTYTYDGIGNLIRMDDPSGTTEYTYDHRDRLVRIDYPGDRWLEFTYDAARRRTSSLDHLGYRLNYHYDLAGRTANLTDGSDVEVVRYEYDLIGRLSRKTLGNGVSTTYEYDPAGRITGLINHAPDNEVLSRFFYTYDRRGLRTMVNTHYGTWTYEYDDPGQLIRAVLNSTDPAINDQELVYVYDALGNRIQTTINGEVTEYESNRMNQYITIGDRNHTCDADGNLIREEGAAGIIIYTYNDENRLVEVTRGNDTWQYTYNALGQRVAMAENGLVTHYVVDPIGLGNVVGEYDADGILLARYTHGFGLVNRMDAAEDVAYHTFDALGNVMELTGISGGVENAYAHGPFGEILMLDEKIPNPFRFVGEQGVMAEGNGLEFMRARFYDPTTGRFTGSDPLGLGGNDFNLYRYALNNPVSLVDPGGEKFSCGVVWGESSSHSTGLGIGYSHGGSVGLSAGVGLGAGWSIGPGAWIGPSGQVGANVGGASVGLGGVGIGATIGAGLGGFVGSSLGVNLGHSYGESWGLFCGWSEDTPQPPDAPGQLTRRGTSEIVIAHDPNEKMGPSGFGSDNYVSSRQNMAYRVSFENLESATAPAQIVTVTDPLSSDLDWTTFEFTEIGFGDVVIPLDTGTRYPDRVVDYHYVDEQYDMALEVHISGGIDMTKGEIYLTFFSIDPETGLPPSVDKGFLPPENGNGRGQGYFTYLIRPGSDLPTGTVIRNIATIQFDFGLSIDTNQIDPMDKTKGTDPDLEALVTMDAGLPTSRIHELPGTVYPTFEVSWSGQDDEGGSGIGFYDIYVRENYGAWTLWMGTTSETSAYFEGNVGHIYCFSSFATDNVGHREDKPALAEATTTTVVWPTPTADAGFDLTVNEGQQAIFDGSASTDVIGIVNYTWTFHDGTGDIMLYGIGPGHMFSMAGVYIVTLNVINAGGLRDMDIMTVTVQDITPPVANAGRDQSIDRGTLVTFDGSTSTDNVGLVNYSWAFHDGTGDRTLFGVAPSYTFTVTGTYAVTLTVTDAAGHIDTDTMTVTVLAPEIIFHAVTLSPERPQDGDTMTLTVSLKNIGQASAQKVIAVVKIDGDVVRMIPLGDIPVGGTATAEHVWTIQKGAHTLEVHVTYTGGEESYNQTIDVRKKSSDSPGFEVAVALVAVGFSMVLFRKKRN